MFKTFVITSILTVSIIAFLCMHKITQSDPFTKMRAEIQNYFKQNNLRISGLDAQLTEKILTKEHLVELLEQAIDDDQKLEIMAKDSQIHPLGFQKIMIMNDWGNNDWELRLHIWWPREELKPYYAFYEVAEARHIHLFSFASRILTGEMEDFRYQVERLKLDELELYLRFENYLANLSREERLRLYTALDIRELAKYPYSSLSLALGRGVDSANKDLSNLPFRDDELQKINSFYTKLFQIYFDEEGMDDALKHRFFKLVPDAPIRYKSGEVYYFPVDVAHRLYVNPASLTSSFFLAGKFQSGVSSGAYTRTAFEEMDGNLPENNRIPFSKEQLRETLLKYLNILKLVDTCQ